MTGLGRQARALALSTALLAGPASASGAGSELRVFAAASLTEVVEALSASFEDARVRASFGGSGALARQIRDGAPADLFLSASPEWMAFLEEAGDLDGAPVVLARNRLVCVAPRGSALAAGGVGDARQLLARLDPGERVGIADPGVPAGEYARAALAHLELAGAFRSVLVGQKDVRAVLHAVELGELTAGFVYATDAAVADVDVLFAFDPSTHPPIEYRAAVVRGAPNPGAARRFLDHLRGETARSVLRDAGFGLP